MIILSYAVIIRGPLGCGKTTVAESLAKILKADHISIDRSLEEHGLDKVDEYIGCVPLGNFIKATDTILPRVEKDLQNGRVVIIDSCFYHKEAIEYLTGKLKCKFYAFDLKAPLETCIRRDADRQKPHGTAAAKAVYSLVSRFDYGVTIDVTKPLEDAVKDIIARLPTS